MKGPVALGTLVVSSALLSFAGTDGRMAFLPIYPPLIPASCPQFPALNGPGVLCEDFDTNRNGVAGFQFTRLPSGVDPNDPLRALGNLNDDVLGYTQRTGAPPNGTGGRVCSSGRGLGRLGCDAPVAEENDWHLHSSFEGPGAGYDPRPGIGAPDGGKAHSGFRSMHWGRHVNFDPPAQGGGDSIRFRQVSAFVLDPEVNLGPASTLQFWHLISVPDDENVGNGFLTAGTTFGGAQVQISLLGTNGRFQKWRRLTPTFNGYDSTIQTRISICQFDPGDDELPPSDDTMCEHSPLWADLGDVLGTDASCATDTDGNDPLHKDCGATSSCTGGPGCTENGSIGTGVWARSAFDLSPFAGRPARLRWVGSMGGGWSFSIDESFLETSTISYQYFDADDGWWIDDIVLTDLRQGGLDCSSDSDGDGVGLCDDCDDSNARSWAQPGEALDVTFPLAGMTMTWDPPQEQGATMVVYDVQRGAPRGFWEGICVETGDSDLIAVDPELPLLNEAFYYLVRARNDCPYGLAALTTNSNGVPRDGRACP
jgi:hypothetical protein